ncbi:hypothetical protein THTE_3080 [Thermogutta terrifontis]|uniref:Uncharacterized protein n=1 Tax=Thermogutta terrifontis TaxID=1331910 RepID=A0A286RIB7_9BACT|nr:hypothetical protein THTE_3080 [Thermogutta terrifontis]
MAASGSITGRVIVKAFPFSEMLHHSKKNETVCGESDQDREQALIEVR